VKKDFDTWWHESGQHWEAACIEAGGTPWVLDPEKRTATAERLGLPEDTDPMELRRALFERRNRNAA
jgi:hypothetical protein